MAVTPRSSEMRSCEELYTCFLTFSDNGNDDNDDDDDNNNKKTVLSQKKPHNAAAVLFGFKFADKVKSSQASKSRLQSSKHTGAKQNLTHIGHSGSFKVTCFGLSGKAIRD